MSQSAIFLIAALLRATVAVVRGDLDEVDAEARERRDGRIVTGVKILRVFVETAKTFSATILRSHLESINGDDDGR